MGRSSPTDLSLGSKIDCSKSRRDRGRKGLITHPDSGPEEIRCVTGAVVHP